MSETLTTNKYPLLIDSFNRKHNYLRISLTDSCNFRCTYCMPDEHQHFLPHNKLMTSDEIEQLAKIFVNHGVNKIRLTGGEPMVRKDFADIISRLAKLNVELLITTNGSLIHQHIATLIENGISSVNVSLDSLKPSTFEQLTKRNQFEKVWNNIQLLLNHNIRIKINAVAIHGKIESEIEDFIQLTKHLPIHVRFIEFMPFTGNHWNKEKVITADEMLEIVNQNFDTIKLQDEKHETAKKYKVIGHEGTFAFITTMSNQFCGECNRLRLTAEGKIKNCLFGKDELDLLEALRKNEDVSAIILQSVMSKHAIMGGQFNEGYNYTDASKIINRSMIEIGG